MERVSEKTCLLEFLGWLNDLAHGVTGIEFDICLLCNHDCQELITTAMLKHGLVFDKSIVRDISDYMSFMWDMYPEWCPLNFMVRTFGNEPVLSFEI